jgi:hypothetical protein
MLGSIDESMRATSPQAARKAVSEQVAIRGLLLERGGRQVPRSWIREVECPACGADQGARCRMAVSGVPRESNHLERIDAWWRAQA